MGHLKELVLLQQTMMGLEIVTLIQLALVLLVRDIFSTQQVVYLFLLVAWKLMETFSKGKNIFYI